jgi:hypothetical protein
MTSESASLPAPWPPGPTQRDVRSAWAPGRTPSPCLPHRGRTRGRSTPAGGPAAFWSRSPASTSTRWSSPRRTFEAAARLAARLQDGMRERAVAPGHSPPR